MRSEEVLVKVVASHRQNRTQIGLPNDSSSHLWVPPSRFSVRQESTCQTPLLLFSHLYPLALTDPGPISSEKEDQAPRVHSLERLREGGRHQSQRNRDTFVPRLVLGRVEKEVQ